MDERAAVIRVAIREADGTIVRAPARAVQWGEAAAFHLSSQTSEHQVDVKVLSDAGLELRYIHNGDTLATEAAGNHVFRTAEGTEISLSIVTTRVRIEGSPS